MKGTQSDRQSGYQFVLGSRIFLISLTYFCLSLWLDGATVTTKQSDAELARALIGTWEIKRAEKSPAVRKFFVSVNADGTFKLITILDFLSFQGRKEDQGKWWVRDGRLITLTLVGSAPQLRHSYENRDKISLQGDTVILQTNGGEQQMYKAPIPSRLPPLLPPHWMDKVIVEKMAPEYPFEARRLYLEGEGFFKLSIDDRTGAVASIQILKSTGHKILDDAAIRAFKTWRFKPEMLRLVGIPIRFTLTGKPHPEKPVGSLIPSQSSAVSPEVVRIP